MIVQVEILQIRDAIADSHLLWNGKRDGFLWPKLGNIVSYALPFLAGIDEKIVHASFVEVSGHLAPVINIGKWRLTSSEEAHSFEYPS